VSEYAVPDRVRWAVEQLNLSPEARVLEFGGGPGAAACLICPQLGTGTLLEIDRSATAVARIRQRCAEYLSAGRLEVRQVALGELKVPDESIDIAFGVNVNLFWTTSAATELAVLHRVLAPGGQLLIAYGPGPSGTDQQGVLNRVRAHVAAAGFGRARILADARASGVIAQQLPGLR
jgi:ubiquinone/menaquinone biosynthesis C-methylase UbiE